MSNPTRRDALRAALALAAGALCPTWLLARSTPAAIALVPFCGHGADTWGNPPKYDFSRPFVQAGAADYSRYATDGHICLRLPALATDRVVGEQTKLPPASGLAWKHDQLRGWKRWPTSEPLVAEDSDCLTCDGAGVLEKGRQECEVCQGLGQSDGDPGFHSEMFLRDCPNCRGTGHVGITCPDCWGRDNSPIGTRPGIQRVGGLYVALRYDQRVREHLRDVEYALVPMRAEPGMIAMRFDGGCGLLMALDGARAEERIRRAGG